MASEDVNLATLWVPVLPETSHIPAAMRKAGEEGRRQFESGFMPEEFAKKLASSINSDITRQAIKDFKAQFGDGQSVGSQFTKGLGDGIKDGMPGISSILQGGIVGGLTAAFVTKGLEVVGEAMTKMAEIVQEGVTEATKAILEVGEAWEQVNRGIETTSSASGAALEGLNRSADNVVKNLDVSMAKVGPTIGTLATRLKMDAGPALENLTRQVLELGDRFGTIDTQKFTAALKGFGVDGAHAGDALQSLVNAARNTSTPLNEVIAGAASGGSVFRQLGLDIGQAGALTAQLTAAGIDAAPIMKALQTAMKKLPKGESLEDGIKGLIDQLKNAGSVAEQQHIAETLFGPKWANALDAINKGLLDTDQLIATFANDGGVSIDQLNHDTETLGNKFEDLKNKAYEAFKGAGTAAVDFVSSGLDKVSGWFSEHHDEIISKIKEFGDKFIDELPKIRDFAADMVALLGHVADGLKDAAWGALAFANGLEQIMAVREILAKPWDDKGYNDLHGAQKAEDDINKLRDMDFSKLGDHWADTIRGMDINTDEWKQNFNDAVDAANNSEITGPTWSASEPGSTGPSVPNTTGLPAAQATAPSGTRESGGVPSSSGADLVPFGGPGGGGRGLILGGGDAALLSRVRPGSYEQPGAPPVWDLTKGLADCSSAVEDLVNIMDGRGTAGRSMSTGNEAQWLTQHGFVPTNTPMPGTFQVGFNGEHTQATLPGGTNFNWGNDSAAANGGVDPGSGGAWMPGFTQHYYRPNGSVVTAPGPGRGGPGRWVLPPLAPAPSNPNDPNNTSPGLNNPGAPSNLGDLGALNQPFNTDPFAGAPSAPGLPQSNPGDAAPTQPNIDTSVPYTPIDLNPADKPGNYKTMNEWISAQQQAANAAESVATTGQELARAQAALAKLLASGTQTQDQVNSAYERVNRAEAAQAKAQEQVGIDQFKDSEQHGGKSKGNSKTESEFSQMGSGLLKGLGQELGFGDLFGKPPWEWGIFKLFTGLAGWGLGEANAWGDALGGGGSSGSSGSGLPGGGNGSSGLAGLLSGMLPGVKSFLPKPQNLASNMATVPNGISSGPNVAAGTGFNAYGGQTGQSAGPGNTAYNDNSTTINLPPAGTTTKDAVGAVQDHLNSSRYTYAPTPGPQG